MRTSHTEIRRKILAEASTLTDKDLFGSSAFGAYLADIAEGATKRYKRKVRVKTYWDDSEGAEIAATNKRTIVVNTGNPTSMGLPTRPLKADSLIGYTAHEVGHILYTDFTVLNAYSRAIFSGQYYPSRPTDLDSREERALEELDAYLDERNEDALKMINYLTHDLHNIVEDAYVNARICQDYPGKFKTGLMVNMVRMMDFCSSILEQIDDGLNGMAICRNLIWQYAISSDINNGGEYKGVYLDRFYECVPLVDSCKFEDDARTRVDAATRMLLVLWEYAKPEIEKAKDEGFPDTQSEMERQFQNGGRGSSPSGSTKGQSGKGYAAPSEEDGDGNGLDEIKQVIAEEGIRIALTKTEENKDGDGGDIHFNDAYGGSGYASCGSDIERLMQTVAEDRVNVLVEQELSEELQQEATRIDYGNVHRGIDITVNRMVEVPEQLVREYQRISPPLLLLSKRMQKQVMQVLKDQQAGGKLNGLMMGRRFEARSVVHDDGRHFSNMKLPLDEPKLVVALLVDESGSMSCMDRITTARAASIVIYDFCRKLGVPVMVTGHTSGGYDTELFSYAEFDSIDNKDAYRIMDMASRSGNRDGAALRYVAERLSKRPEHNKILILISDGQPASDGYYGTAAEADLRGIKLEYSRKGVTLFAAAIGDDKEDIQRIYGDGYLDITDLNMLPVNLTRLIQRYVQAA